MLVLFSMTNLPWQLDDLRPGQTSLDIVRNGDEGHWFYQRTSDDQGLATSRR